MRRTLSVLVLVVVLLTGAGAALAEIRLEPGEGFVPVPGGPVWYRIYGGGTATPLLIVHGGPGGTSCAFEPLATLLGKTRPVVVYDQLGSGRSGRPIDRALWTAERSVQELAAVRKALGLKKVHLMGHSWGGALVAAYTLGSKPPGIESLVLAGPLLSTKRWIEDANILRSQLPTDVQAVLTQNEQAGTLESPEYRAATEVFYSHFLFHGPQPKLPASCAEAPFNNEIYQLMWGPTEFKATGNLLDFDVTPRLSELKMPVLFLVGRYDEARPETVATFQSAIPGAVLTVFEHSGHEAPIEEYAAYAQTLDNFLSRVEHKKLPAHELGGAPSK